MLAYISLNHSLYCHLSGIRLVDGSEASGIIEVYHNKEWRSVCDDHWSDVDANVACAQLGYFGYGE